MKQLFLLFLIAILVAADYLSKLWISEKLFYGQGFIINDYLNIIRIHNKGAAFGFLNDQGGWQLFFLTALALLVSAVLIYWLYEKTLNAYKLLAFALISAGALGNALDRLLYGYVIDFIDFHYKNWHYPAFNIADISISFGAFLLIVDLLIIKKI